MTPYWRFRLEQRPHCEQWGGTPLTRPSRGAINAGWVDEQKLIVQELCESRGGRPGLSVLTSLLVSVDVKLC